MAFCPNCGSEVNDEQDVCLSCGKAIKNNGNVNQVVVDQDAPVGCGIGLVSFLFPIVGLVLYLVWMNSNPKAAKVAGKWALISVILGIVVSVLSAVIVAVIAASATGGIYY